MTVSQAVKELQEQGFNRVITIENGVKGPGISVDEMLALVPLLTPKLLSIECHYTVMHRAKKAIISFLSPDGSESEQGIGLYKDEKGGTN